MCTQPEVYDIVYGWRDVLDEWKKAHGTESKIMMTEAYTNITNTMRYYVSQDGTRKGSHIPFNFQLVSNLNRESTANQFVSAINTWMSFLPAGSTANWVVSK